MTLLKILAPLCLAALHLPVTSAQELRRSGFIGVSATALTDEARKQLPPNESGILVQAVVDGGSAKDSGIQPNDIIAEVNEHKIIGVNDFVQTIKILRAGDNAKLYLRRNGEALAKNLLIKPRPQESAADVDTLYKAVEVDGSLRRVIVTVPKTRGGHPAVLYINGIGCFSQESANLQSNDAKLLYGLSRAGFVTMRVEKSSMGDSEGPPCLSPAVDLNVATTSPFQLLITYMQQWAALNPVEEWKKISAPVLIVYGTSDFVSTIADDPYMLDVINSFHPAHATLKAIPNMDHPMNKAASMEESMKPPANVPTEFEPAVLDAVKTWLQTRI